MMPNTAEMPVKGNSGHLLSEALHLRRDVLIMRESLRPSGTIVLRMGRIMHDIRLSHARCIGIRGDVHSWASLQLFVSIPPPHSLEKIIHYPHHLRRRGLFWLGSSARWISATDRGATKGEAAIGGPV